MLAVLENSLIEYESALIQITERCKWDLSNAIGALCNWIGALSNSITELSNWITELSY